MTTLLVLSSLVLSSLVLSTRAMAEDLYPPAPPKDSAFVRIIQVDASAKPGPAKVGAQDLGTLEPGGITSYVVVPGGSAETQLGALSATLTYSTGEFYTVAPVAGALQVIQDARNTSLAKASIQLYNFTDQPDAKLTTGDGTVEVITGVAAGAHGDRAVNALTTDLAVWLGDQKVASFPSISLERSRAYSAVLTDSPDGPTAVWVTNSTR